jgi:aldose 1-epimerase
VAELPTGQQVLLRRGNQQAIVVEFAGGLRSYEVGSWAVVEGYPAHGMADGGRGIPMLPWPNRLADGHYEFEGQSMQLPIDEIQRNNAIHGFTRSMNWIVEDQREESAALGLKVHPRPGYPFSLKFTLEYSLLDTGLVIRLTARNTGDRAAPFGAGHHPYFSVGTPTVDTSLLRLEAETRLELDPRRRLPTGHLLPTKGTQYDFRQPRRIGEQVLDDCFTNLLRDPDRRARFTLIHPQDEREVTVWADSQYRYVQVFSGDTLPAARRRSGLALEPMTCPPNAFQTGTDILVLQPGQSQSMEWGISPTLTKP